MPRVYPTPATGPHWFIEPFRSQGYEVDQSIVALWTPTSEPWRTTPWSESSSQRTSPSRDSISLNTVASQYHGQDTVRPAMEQWRQIIDNPPSVQDPPAIEQGQGGMSSQNLKFKNLRKDQTR